MISVGERRGLNTELGTTHQSDTFERILTAQKKLEQQHALDVLDADLQEYLFQALDSKRTRRMLMEAVVRPTSYDLDLWMPFRSALWD